MMMNEFGSHMEELALTGKLLVLAHIHSSMGLELGLGIMGYSTVLWSFEETE
jgi:hypothetical protein